MKAIIQRVAQAMVEVDSKITGQIDAGLLVYLGIAKDDTDNDMLFLAEKIINLRIFPDKNEKMNLSLIDTKGSILLVSQFTLLGNCLKGKRPGFDDAAKGPIAKQFYEDMIEYFRSKDICTQTGIFAANMQVTSTNSGPVTFILG